MPPEKACVPPEPAFQNFDDHAEDPFQQNWLKVNLAILGQSNNK